MNDQLANYLSGAFALGRASHAYIVVGEKAQLPDLLRQCAAICLCRAHNGKDGCDNCRKVRNGSHQDVMWYPGNSSRLRVNVADMQNLVEEASKRPIDNGDCRVFLINAADSLVGASSEVWQNKLLKTLEEPTAGTFIFVGVTDAEGLLPTVRSRCQTLKLAKTDEAQIVSALQSEGYEKSLCEVAAAACGGNPDTAKAIFADPSIFRAFDNAADMLQNMSSTKNSLRFVSKILADKDYLPWFLRFSALLLAESIYFRLAENLCVLPSHRQTIQKICQNYSLQAAEVCIEKISFAKKRLDQSGSVTVVTDNLINTILEVKYRCRI